jgi:hypothetical protein
VVIVDILTAALRCGAEIWIDSGLRSKQKSQVRRVQFGVDESTTEIGDREIEVEGVNMGGRGRWGESKLTVRNV